MKRLLYLCLFFTLLLSACSETTRHLTRVDVLIINGEEIFEVEEMILDLVTLDSIESFLQEVKWEKEIPEKIGGKEAVQLTVFYTDEESKNETLYLYRVWFNKDNSVKIISTNEEEPYGTLDGKDGLKLKNLLIH